jgi:hypothetical protein
MSNDMQCNTALISAMILSSQLLERSMSTLAPKLRLVRPAPDLLGLYVRAGSIGREGLRNFTQSINP